MELLFSPFLAFTFWLYDLYTVYIQYFGGNKLFDSFMQLSVHKKSILKQLRTYSIYLKTEERKYKLQMSTTGGVH